MGKVTWKLDRCWIDLPDPVDSRTAMGVCVCVYVCVMCKSMS